MSKRVAFRGNAWIHSDLSMYCVDSSDFSRARHHADVRPEDLRAWHFLLLQGVRRRMIVYFVAGCRCVRRRGSLGESSAPLPLPLTTACSVYNVCRSLSAILFCLWPYGSSAIRLVGDLDEKACPREQVAYALSTTVDSTW